MGDTPEVAASTEPVVPEVLPEGPGMMPPQPITGTEAPHSRASNDPSALEENQLAVAHEGEPAPEASAEASLGSTALDTTSAPALPSFEPATSTEEKTDEADADKELAHEGESEESSSDDDEIKPATLESLKIVEEKPANSSQSLTVSPEQFGEVIDRITKWDDILAKNDVSDAYKAAHPNVEFSAAKLAYFEMKAEDDRKVIDDITSGRAAA